MANNDNLKGHGFHERTASEQREIAKLGGKASGKARRRKADFRKTLNMLLTVDIEHPEITPILDAMGIDSTLESAMLMAQIKEAMAGNTKAAYFVAQYAGQSTQSVREDEEQQIRIDRAKRARDQEIGNVDSAEDNIKDFLKAINPTEEDMASLFDDEEGDSNGEEEETASEI